MIFHSSFRILCRTREHMAPFQMEWPVPMQDLPDFQFYYLGVLVKVWNLVELAFKHSLLTFKMSFKLIKCQHSIHNSINWTVQKIWTSSQIWILGYWNESHVGGSHSSLTFHISDICPRSHQPCFTNKPTGLSTLKHLCYATIWPYFSLLDTFLCCPSPSTRAFFRLTPVS